MNKKLKSKIIFFGFVFLFMASAMHTSASTPDYYTVKLNAINNGQIWYGDVPNGFEIKYSITYSDSSSVLITYTGPDRSGTQTTTSGYLMYSVMTKLYYVGVLVDWNSAHFVFNIWTEDDISFTLDHNGYIFVFKNTFTAATGSPPGGGGIYEPGPMD